MKRSDWFWTIIFGIIILIAHVYLLASNTNFQHPGDWKGIIMVLLIIIDFVILMGIIFYIIPRFNNWIDGKPNSPFNPFE